MEHLGVLGLVIVYGAAFAVAAWLARQPSAPVANPAGRAPTSDEEE